MNQDVAGADRFTHIQRIKLPEKRFNQLYGKRLIGPHRKIRQFFRAAMDNRSYNAAWIAHLIFRLGDPAFAGIPGDMKRTVFPNRDLKMTSRRAADADFFNFLHAFTSSSSKFRFSPAVQSAVSAAGRFTAIISAGLTQRSFFRRITLSPALTTSSAAEATIFGRM